MEFYSEAELLGIVERGARLLRLELTGGGAAEIARRSRGTPRVATRLLRRVRDFATVEAAGQGEGPAKVDAEAADRALTRLAVDKLGLDSLDRRYLQAIAVHYGAGGRWVETLAAALSSSATRWRRRSSPYLLQQGLLQRTPRGRS
jgi:Holliday junction DNA helicase RuvB